MRTMPRTRALSGSGAGADKTARQEQELKAELRSFRQLLQNASSNDLLAQWQPALAQAAQQLGAFSWEQNQVDQDALGQIIRDLGER